MNQKKKRNPKILIIGIHGPYEPWLEILKNGQSKTWMINNSSSRIINAFGQAMNGKARSIDEKIYYLRWSKNRFVAYGSLLLEAVVKTVLPLNKYWPAVDRYQEGSLFEHWQIRMPDSLLLQGVKNVSVFRKSLDLDYDFLVTTITSSYLNVPLLEDTLRRVPFTNFLGGRIEKSGKMEFQQGSFRVYSRDVVIKLVENFNAYKHWKIEDIAMANLASNFYDKFVNLPNHTLQSVKDVDLLTKKHLNSILSYRCKATESNNRIDALIMKSLHKRILSGE